jgi:hypothetical protein
VPALFSDRGNAYGVWKGCSILMLSLMLVRRTT